MESTQKELKPQELVPNLHQLEEEHVHTVYDLIASHFSATRYKPWPIVDNYLQ